MESSTRIERIAAEWLARRDSEAWDEAQQARFEAWLNESTAHRVAWLRLNAAWQRSDRLKALGAGIPPGQIPRRGQWTLSPYFNPPTMESRTAAASQAASGKRGTARTARPTEVRKPRPFFRLGAVAASVTLMVSVALVWWHFGAVEQANYTTAVGGMHTVALADDSTVTLSSNSRVEVTLSRGERRVDLLSGEVYFEVAEDPARPFVVQAGQRRVLVTGTRFAVRSGAGDLRVVVTEGRVELQADSRTTRPPVLLKAGMVAQAGKAGVKVQTYPPERAEEMLSWRSGFLSFRDTPLAEAVAEFNRYNNRQLVINDPAIAAIPIGGNFRWSNTDAFVRLLEQGFDLRAEHRGNQIVLRGQ